MCIDLVFFERPKDLQPPFVMHLSTLADVLALDQGGFLIIMAVSGKYISGKFHRKSIKNNPEKFECPQDVLVEDCPT